MSLPRELLQQVLDQVPSRVVLFDREQRYCYANEAALDFLGLAREAVIGRTVGEVRGDEIATRNRAVFDRIFAGESLHWEGWTDYPGRGRFYTEESLAPYAAPGEPVSLIIAFARDLTEVKLQDSRLGEQRAALQRAEQLKTAIVDHALAALVTTDAQGAIVEFNRAAETMFGLPRAQAVGRPVADVMIPPRHRGAHSAGMARMAAGGAPRVLGQRMELAALRADGSEFPIEMVLWRTDLDGEVHYTAAISDRSEQVRAAAVIERQRDALRQAEKIGAMGSLLAGVAHELNNPLAIVMGRSGLLEDKVAGTDLADDAARIREAAERCGRIVRTFLNMARSKPPQRGPVALNDLVRAAAELLQYGLRTHGVQLALALDPALPQVHADADQIGQIVLNLMVNAQHALASAGQPRLLKLATGTDHGQVWLRVLDNGPGVPLALRDNIFEPFFTTKPSDLGTGLGLSVSRSLAREHGGELMLDNEATAAAGGACFVLSLPLLPVASPESTRTAQAGGGGDAEPAEPATAARLLVVDDEQELAELLRQLLEDAGYEVATAESGLLALAMLDEVRFDGLICDLRMPELDGAGLWRELQQRWPALARRVLFVTGDTLSPGARGFLDSSGCDALEKPFARAELLARVSAMLAR